MEGGGLRVATTSAEFARRAVEHGPAHAFASVLADDAVFLAPNHPTLYGADDIVTYLDGAPGLRMTWTTADAEVARSCDIGYTFGAWTAGGEDADGNPVVAQGKYLATWRHVRDIGWRLTVYIQNLDAPDVPAEGV
jgi:ketosteroid isomerase-like protein